MIRALLAGAVLLGLGVVTGCSHVRIPAGSAGGKARSLPLRAMPVRGDTGRVFAIVLTGDGPTGGLGKEIGSDLQSAGVPSVVWHTSAGHRLNPLPAG